MRRPDVASNGFGAAGAKSFGFNVARIERVTPSVLRNEIAASGTIGSATMFKALRLQIGTCGEPAGVTIPALRRIPDALTVLERTGPGRWVRRASNARVMMERSQ